LYEPKNFVVRYEIARAHRALGEFEQARQSALDTLELKGDFLPAWVILAEIQFRGGEFGPAAKSVDEILALSPQNHAGVVMHRILQGLDTARVQSDRVVSAFESAAYPYDLSIAATKIGESNYAEAEKYLTLYEHKPFLAFGSQPIADGRMTADQFIYLKNSPCNEAIARFRAWQSSPADPFDLAKPIPGVSYPVRTGN